MDKRVTINPGRTATSTSSGSTAFAAWFIGSRSVIWIAVAILLLMVPAACITVLFGDGMVLVPLYLLYETGFAILWIRASKAAAAYSPEPGLR